MTVIKMFKEKVLIIFLAVLGGIIFSVGLFYLYQKTKVIVPSKISKSPAPLPTPPPFSLKIENPQDEAVLEKRIAEVSGKTSPRAIVLVSLEDREIVLTPSSDGAFSTSIPILDNVNLIEIIAISPEGETLVEKRTLTFTTEKF